MDSMVDLELERLDGVPVMRIRGEVDISVVAMVEKRLRGAATDGAPGLVVDLTDLDYLDSAGLRLLLEFALQLGERDQGLRLVAPEGKLAANLLEMTRIDEIIAVDRTLDDALAGFASAG